MYLSYYSWICFILREGDVKYVISFDESLNKVQQLEQMDMIICFWDNQKNEVCSRYFDSRFLGHTTAGDSTKFKEFSNCT